MHESMTASTSGLRVIDSVRAEFYERTNYRSATGFNFGAGRKVSRRLTLEGGYASIDRYFGDLNADAFIHGNRLYAGGEFEIARAFTVFALVNHGVNNSYELENRTHLHVGFSYDVIKALQHLPKS